MQLLTGHANSVNDIAFSPDGRLLASCGNDKTVRVWDTLTGEGSVLFEDEGFCDGVAFAPDGEHLLVRPRSGGLLVWSVADRRCAARLIPSAAVPHARVLTVFGPSRGRLAVAPASGLVAAIERTEQAYRDVLRLWEAGTWAGRGTLELRGLGGLAFDPEGTRLATAGGLLDTRTGEWTRRSWPTSGAGALAWSPTAPLVAGSGSDGAAWSPTRRRALWRCA